MTITNFNYEGLYFPGLICNIVVKVVLGRSAGRSISPSTDILLSRMAIGRSAGRSIPADLLADLSPKCIMGYILWDVFGSHFGFFKKRWEFPLISEIIRVVNSQLALYSHVQCNPQNTLKTPPK